MKQKIILSIDGQLLKRARALAAQRGTSISGLLAAELEKMVSKDQDYEQAKARALARLRCGFHLGGAKMSSREEVHRRGSPLGAPRAPHRPKRRRS